MAPSIWRYVPFTKNSAIRSPIPPILSRGSPFAESYKRIDDQDQIPLKPKGQFSAFEVEPAPDSRSIVSSPEKRPHISSLERPKHSKYGIHRGWKGGARFAFYTAFTVLVINTTLLIVGSTAWKWMDSMTMVYVGTCTKTERINAGLHFVVNVLSTCLLAASNYCMQLLSAPTREDIDAAHAKGRWLDVGIPSIRNLMSLKWKKRLLWWVLAVSSIPLHLLYNSVFFSAIATNDYHILYATPDFAEGALYNTTLFPNTDDFNITKHQVNAKSFQRLDKKECIRAYAQDFITERKDVIAVVANITNATSSLLKIATDEIPKAGITPGYDPFSWICDDPKTIGKTGAVADDDGSIPCRKMIENLEGISSVWWRSGGFDIDYCLSESFEPDCHEHFAPPVMAPVLFFNIFKAAVIWYVAFKYKDKPIVTVGDAIESFIKNPDPTTKNMCLATHKQIEHNWTKGYIPQPLRYTTHNRRWYSAVTWRQWALLSFLLASATMITALGIGYGIHNLNPSTIQQAWNMGMGTVRQQNVISGLRVPSLGSNAVFVSALIANTPQALFSFIYLVYNAVFSTMFLGREWDRFATHPKGRILRVSAPVAEQRSTYILQVPYKYAIIMLSTSAVLHWLVSQSIFLANISVIPLNGEKPKEDEITSCAYSVKGMIFVLVVGLVMILWVAGHGLRRYSGLMVMVGSNTAAISAACHVLGRTGGERDAMVLRPLRWGATEYGSRRSTTWGSASTNYQQNPESISKNQIGDDHHHHSRSTSQASSGGAGGGRGVSYAWMSHTDTAYHGRGLSRDEDGFEMIPPPVPGKDSNYSRPLRNIYFPPPPGAASATGPVHNNHHPIHGLGLGHGHNQSGARNRFHEVDANGHALDEAEAGFSTGADQVGHCSFSDGHVGRPVPGRLYA